VSHDKEAEESAAEKPDSTDDNLVGTINFNDPSFWIEDAKAFNREMAERALAATHDKKVFRALDRLRQDVLRGAKAAVRDAVLDTDTMDALAREAYLDRRDPRHTARRLGREWALKNAAPHADQRSREQRFEERRVRRDERKAKENGEREGLLANPELFV